MTKYKTITQEQIDKWVLDDGDYMFDITMSANHLIDWFNNLLILPAST